jgi:alpha,alpha-trehalase
MLTDAGIPPRGWHGEAYRGHIMWDELFILQFLNMRNPALTRANIGYRYRRLDEARRLAREAGYKGAMYPWQSGSNGREESQLLHLNPMSGNWIPDNSYRQRHINCAVAYTVWRYYEITEDREFLCDTGAEMLLEIARFFADLAKRDAGDGRYHIRGVMGPDEFHTAYPGRDPTAEGGLDDNAYTNVMVAWLMVRALEALELVPALHRQSLQRRLGLEQAELDHWDTISRKLAVPFHDGGVISQFAGYGDLKEFDWQHYRQKYGDIQRLDRILEQEGDDPNNYKASKQADVLMLFYLFSSEELAVIFERLGCPLDHDTIPRTIDYYMQRTSHGSTLSFITHSWVMARENRAKSWNLFQSALQADIADIQGGTTKEGVHLGAMAGVVDIIQRCFTGLEARNDTLYLNPMLPTELDCISTSLRYRDHTLAITVDQEEVTIASRFSTAEPIRVAYRGQTRILSPNMQVCFRLVPHHAGTSGLSP